MSTVSVVWVVAVALAFVGVCTSTVGCSSRARSSHDAGPNDAGAKQVASQPADADLDAGPSTDASGTHGKTDATITECRSDSDCPKPGLSNVPWGCVRPYDAYRCGPVEPNRVGAACTEDDQCGGGNICRAATVHDDGGMPDDGGLGLSGLACTRAVACTADAQCNAGQVCRGDPAVPIGWIDPSGLVCSAPCATDLDCPPTDKCSGGGHCQARTCAECPSYLSCKSGTCVVPRCSTDTDCPGGYCVAGSCAGSLGVCRPECS